MTTVFCIKKENLIKNGYKDLEDWLKNPDHIYIARDMTFYVKGANKSKWSNPFKAKKVGTDKCVEMYRTYLENSKELLEQIGELDGKTLGCWCENTNKCHGSIILEFLNNSKKVNAKVKN